jgi:pimeloyl-ACP methyl ester carboxylesterase
MHAADYWYDSRDGLRLYSRVYAGPSPQAPVVLCLHGLMRNGRDFAALATHLAQRHRVLVPDVRGRGLSARDPDSSRYRIDTYLEDVQELLRGLGVTQLAVIGTSMGGLMGMMLGWLQPGLVTALVLNDVGPQLDPRGLERIRGYAGRAPPVSSWAEAVAQVRHTYSTAWPDLSAARWEEVARLSYRADAHGVPAEDADPAVADALRGNTLSPDLWPLWQGLARLPALVIRGAHSDLLSEATLARMQREKPELAVLTVANRGHAPLLDEAGCVAAIDRLLREGPAG